MTVDIQQLFETTLPAALAAKPEKAAEVGARFQLNISGEGGGQWFVDASPTGPSCTAGEPGGADCTISLAAEDFQALYENPQAAGMQLFFAGKLRVTGNQMLALKLSKLFEL
jgi:hypothetical protein